MFLSVKEVWHVGDMDINLKSNFSLEGDLLSVSQTPQTWNKIGRLNGNNNRLEFNEALYVDYYYFKEKYYNAVIDWALENHYIIESQTFSYAYYDDEMEDELEFIFDTIDELLEEFPDVEDEDISTDLNWKLTEGFKLENKSSSKSDFDLTNLHIKYIEQNILTQNENVVGVWWNDNFDPLRYSAPRGGIFNEKLSLFKIYKEDSLFDIDIESSLYNI